MDIHDLHVWERTKFTGIDGIQDVESMIDHIASTLDRPSADVFSAVLENTVKQSIKKHIL